MKITFLVSGSIHSNFSYRALALAKGLHALGHEISIIAPKADKYNNFVSENITSIDGIKILQPFQFATKRLEINLLPYIFGAAKNVLHEKPDLIYIYKPTPISAIGLIGKIFRKTPVIVDMDDLGSEVMRIEGHPWYQRVLVSFCEHFAIKHADRIIVASSYLFDTYQNKFPKKPIHIMPNGVEADWFVDPILSQHKKRIVFLGSINRKSILDPLFDILPEVIKENNDVTIIIIGDGTYLPYFKEKSKSLNISSNVEFTGWMTLQEARSHLHVGDIGYCYMPDELTIKAASNMKVPQYMSRGVVPLVSNIGDLPATVDFGNAGYIAPANDTNALKETLMNALNDKGRIDKARNAQIFAKEKFNWDALAMDVHIWLKPEKKRKIYFVTITVPGNIGGGEIRNYNLIKQWMKQNHSEVEVFCVSPGDPRTAKEKFESNINATLHPSPSRSRTFATTARAILWEHVPPFMDDFTSSGIGREFRVACEKSLPDIVQIEQLQAYYCIQPHISWLKSKGVKIIFDCHNVEFQSFKDSLELFSTPKKIMGIFLTPFLKRMEIEAAKKSDVIFACSRTDADFFKKYNAKTYVIPNGVDCSEFTPPEKKAHSTPILIFMGAVQYPPNGDGLEFYLKNIHPKIVKGMPNIKLFAIGADKKWLDAIGVNDPSIDPLGFVDDVRPYLHEATVGICPIRYGSGTRIKIMTYMAAGLPVVSTQKGAEGVTYANGHDIIINDDPEEFAKAILKILTDDAYRENIATNGRNFILQNFDWNVIGSTLANIYEHELR